MPAAVRRLSGFARRVSVWTSVLLIPQVLLAGTLSVQIDGVDDSLKPAVTAAAEIMQYDKRDVSAAQARRLYDRAPEQIAKSLEAYGYYNATADGELKEAPPGFVAVLHVHPGEPTTVATFKIDVPDPARDEKPVAKALAEFTPRQGQRFDHGAYEKSKAAVQAALVATGYLDASLATRRVEVSRSANRATIELQWSTGVRYRYGKTTFSGDQFAEGMLDRYVPWHEGDFYAQLQLLKLQQRLIDADYFGIIDVQPDLENAHDGVIPIAVKLAPAKRTVYTAGVFIDTDIGFGVKGSVRRRWVNDLGHKAKVEAEIAQRLKSIAATYSIPLPGENNRSLNFGIGYLDENTKTTTQNTASVVANETRQWLDFTRTLGLHLVTGDFTIVDPNGNKALEQKGHSTLLYPEIVLEKKRADDPLFVRDGYAITVAARASPGLLSDTHFAQVRGDAKWIRAFGDSQRLIVRGSLGAMEVGNFDELTPDLRFFAGGDRSIRGYAFQTIGPQTPQGLVIGGEDLVVASAEYEYYFKPNWGIATFIDTGDAFTGFSNFKTRIGTGVGLRWRSPVGMVRADIGVPVNDPYGKTGVQLHLVIGPDL
ncbi:MAG TPA: autotransporter assembly complex family protein [Rudaea sp.]|nr:autotransporter assembly complex family protein [Rudaea sp.]